MQWRNYYSSESYETTVLCPHCWKPVSWGPAVKFCALCGQQAEGLDESHRQRGQPKWQLRLSEDAQYEWRRPLPQPRWHVFQRHKGWDNQWTLMGVFLPLAKDRADALAIARWTVKDDPDMDCALVWGVFDYKHSFDVLPEGISHVVK